ncbi:MAG: OpgC domain-containing protein [Gammaproteobacteria bacterium]|nr:OpgC domain-containing protein [Gammaproteobacteria bacterium]MBU1442868.1 OpgC domain-containing protein [Gammaproteobacteria bacterium]MBU2285079.1 OpgC domain-containing protein [Gammaproteobacteria bacterium]MBU2410889.1 OpgC domain-containing protein [Gammaproteobacteria bacterium]
MNRLWEIDALRGLMLVLMTITHLPSRFTDPVGQPFGFVSSAEGFVLLSAAVAGIVYTRIGQNKGVPAMRQAFWRRALKIYLAQAAALLFLFTIIRGLGMRFDQLAVKEMLAFFLSHPVEGIVYSLLLVYEPPLFDILPMYIFFMLMSPWVLAHALRHGWGVPMALSATLWALAQFDIAPAVYNLAVRFLHLPVPYADLGSFDAFAWQFLWFGGLWLGARYVDPDARPLAFPRWVVVFAAGVALFILCWRHFGPGGQAAFGDNQDLNLLFDKWRLGPLRLLDLLALIILAMRFGRGFMRRIPRLHFLESMGAASLPVFCAHLAAVLLVKAIFGADYEVRPWWGDVLMLAAVFTWMYAVARATLWLEARPGREA